jgi:hypothetical protein
MLRILSITLIILAGIEALCGLLLLTGTIPHAGLDFWPGLRTAIGLQAIVLGVLFSLFGAAGLALDDIRRGGLRAETRAEAADAAARQREAAAREEALMHTHRHRLAATHGVEIAAAAVRIIALRKAEGRHIREADALAQAKVDVARDGSLPRHD